MKSSDNPTRTLRHSGLVAAAIWLLATSLTAQTSPTGVLTGKVLNATSGNYLNNVRVVVKDTRLEANTNENGEYRIVGVAAGPVTVLVSYTGMTPQTKSVLVPTGQVARLDFDLVLFGAAKETSAIIKLDAFTVAERELTAQGNALHEQRTAGNIKNVVSIEEFGDLGITNPGHFLTYVPGVSNVYNTTGEVEGIGLRGMSSSGTVVMIDGAEAASNDPASRAYNFSGTSTTNLDRIEISKVPMPDMPANAVGGSINMVSKSGFHRRTRQLRYNVFATMQAKGTNLGVPHTLSSFAGPDDRTTMWPVQPGFDVSYTLPLNEAVAFTFNAGHNARYQDREYMSPGWDRTLLVQTTGSLNSPLNIFTKDIAAVGADWKSKVGVIRARVDFTTQNAYTRQASVQWNAGAGATGGETFTNGAPAGVGTLTATSGQSLNQYRRLLNGRISHTYAGDIWKLDWNASYSEARRLFSDIDEGFFGGANATISNVVVSVQGLDGINRVQQPTVTAKTRTGLAIDPNDVNHYTLNTASSGRMYFKNTLGSASANAARSFATTFPLTLKAGATVGTTLRDNWTESMSWNFRPPASAGGQLVGNYDLLADSYSARREFKGGLKIKYLSTAKLWDIYKQHPEYFQFQDAAAYANRVNNSKKLEETISAAYLRTDVKALDNRLWIITGVRFERTDDTGYGPLNDIRNTYVKNATGQIVLASNGRPTPISTDALALAKLQFKERAAYNEKSYQGFYPSVNASYALGSNFVLRAAYAGTIGRPDLSFITPGTSITDPSASTRTITVVNTGLQPWTANNYDLTLESYEYQGATVSISGFRKDVAKFFTAVRTPATQALLDQYGLPADLLTGDYEIITRENSPLAANLQGFEWSWRQSLRPLAFAPPWVRSVGFFVNGTHLRIGGPGVANFTGYSTRIINWGASYTRANFALKLNATASNGPRNASSADGTYTGLAPRTLLGGSLEYRLSKRVTLHLSGQNLSYAYYRSMTYAPGRPAYVQPSAFRDLGTEYVFGVKGEF
jgi:iron complex outermembrane receptor protein